MAKKDLPRAFAAVVRQRRLELGVSQEELAARAGLHRNYIGMVERAERNPSLIAIGGIAKGLNTSPSALLSKVEDSIGWKR
jgi:transcriptional regulator with XRE-family HTH domain